MDPLTLRAIERILAVAIGGLSIVLGYRLFLRVPMRQDSSGEFKLPWSMSIGLSRVGPGAFFALFGAAVVGYSLHGAMRFSDVVQPQGAGKAVETQTIEATGAMPVAPGGGGSLAARRVNLQMQVEFLNTLGQRLRSDLSDEEKRAAAASAAKLKLEVIKSVWGDDWGDWARFLEWADGDANGPPPKGMEAPARYFQYGKQGTQ